MRSRGTAEARRRGDGRSSRLGAVFAKLVLLRVDDDMKVRAIIRLLEEDGWYMVATKGSHRQFKHRGRPGRVTVAGHSNDDLAPMTLNSILKQARLKREE